MYIYHCIYVYGIYLYMYTVHVCILLYVHVQCINGVRTCDET